MKSGREARHARIRKLLALAKDQEGTPEGEAAARLARVMMRRQALAWQHLGRDEARTRDPVARQALDLGGKSRWRTRLATVVARHCECVVAWERDSLRAWLVGHHSALDVADYLYAVLCRELEQERAAFEAGMDADASDAPRRAAVGDFCQSAVLALDVRLQRWRTDDDGRHPTGAALVRCRRDDVRSWLREQGVSLRASADRPHGYSQEGYEAGYRLPLHDAVRSGDPVGAVPIRGGTT